MKAISVRIFFCSPISFFMPVNKVILFSTLNNCSSSFLFGHFQTFFSFANRLSLSLSFSHFNECERWGPRQLSSTTLLLSAYYKLICSKREREKEWRTQIHNWADSALSLLISAADLASVCFIIIMCRPVCLCVLIILQCLTNVVAEAEAEAAAAVVIIIYK